MPGTILVLLLLLLLLLLTRCLTTIDEHMVGGHLGGVWPEADNGVGHVSVHPGEGGVRLEPGNGIPLI